MSATFPRVTVHARRRCHDAGAVLRFARVEAPGAAPGDERSHRRAAVAGVAGIASADPASPDALTGRRVSLAGFYGPAFDTATGTLSGERVANDEDDDFSSRGFVVALLKPPYGIKPSRAGYADEQELLTDVITNVLHRPTAATPIWHWTGDWCPYFDAGREWWGAGAWTLEVRPGEILVVAASATD